jgi:hypothetical protein
MTRALGWERPTVINPGRRIFAAKPGAADPLANLVASKSSDNTALLPEQPFDQKQFLACVGNAVTSSIIGAHARVNAPISLPSRMAIWQRALSYSGRWGNNEGVQICTAIDLCVEMGIPLERDWQYDDQHFAAHPGPAVDVNAYPWRGRDGYHAVASWGDALIADLEKACTAGYIPPFGVYVTEAFCANRPTGTVHAPKPGEKIAGGHAFVLGGHDRRNERFLGRGSWGVEMGDPSLPPGYLWLGYDYLRTASDIWLVDAIGGAA